MYPPRDADAGVGEWGEIIDVLPLRIGEWLARLNSEGVVGADAIYSCIGPAMELYSRYDSVERVDGTVVTISEFLEVLWNTVARSTEDSRPPVEVVRLNLMLVRLDGALDLRQSGWWTW